VTDGQTDRQTDRILLAIPRLHYMQRGKNELSLVGSVSWSVARESLSVLVGLLIELC